MRFKSDLKAIYILICYHHNTLKIKEFCTIETKSSEVFLLRPKKKTFGHFEPKSTKKVQTDSWQPWKLLVLQSISKLLILF